MKKPSRKLTLGLLSAAVLVAVGAAVIPGHAGGTDAKAPAPSKAVLNVNALTPKAQDWTFAIPANGSVQAWQEAQIGSELGGLRLAEVGVNVGDVVQRGQVLARLSSDTVAAELAQQEASVDEAVAALGEARANANRARALTDSGALSAQQIQQALTAETSAAARLNVARARLNLERLRLAQTVIKAPDAGVISSRSAAVGSVIGQGQELFKLIRQNRLEWRAELTAEDVQRVKPGQLVKLNAAGGAPLEGRVRVVAPSVDPATRRALAYVDLPASASLQAGAFATGRIELGQSSALTVPQSAVLTSDGFSYVFQIGERQKVERVKVALGRRVGERVEVVSGLKPDATLVATGASFLNDGDTVAILSTGSTGAVVASR